MKHPVVGMDRAGLFVATVAALGLWIGLPGAGTAQTTDAMMNRLTPAEQQAGWILLFDGKSLDGWEYYGGEAVTDGWGAVDGALTRLSGGGDIVTSRIWDDFELVAEWKVEEGGNSGILYRAAPGSEEIYHSAPEMQILDDERHPDGRSPLTSSGANYALHAAPRGVVRPAGKWNQIRLVVEGAHVEHWLNGTKIVEYELWSPEWEALVAESKFAQWPEYGRATSGHIGLQDHGSRVEYRNIKVRPIS